MCFTAIETRNPVAMSSSRGTGKESITITGDVEGAGSGVAVNNLGKRVVFFCSWAFFVVDVFLFVCCFLVVAVVFLMRREGGGQK